MADGTRGLRGSWNAPPRMGRRNPRLACPNSDRRTLILFLRIAAAESRANGRGRRPCRRKNE